MEKSNEITSIDEVVARLEYIINEAVKENSPMGYFAALYQKVTIKVKEEIENNFFENGPRMEKLDVVFAKRYLDAYSCWKEKKEITESWQYAFEMDNNNQLIVLQHLLLGMNAHINLDLGIAAAEISSDENINDLEQDFNKINEILSSLVIEIQNDLAKIWPMLKRILKWTRNVDDFFIDFSMELARDGAWKFAKEIANESAQSIQKTIVDRDIKVSRKAFIVTKPGTIASVILRIVRWGERGSTVDKISLLR